MMYEEAPPEKDRQGTTAWVQMQGEDLDREQRRDVSGVRSGSITGKDTGIWLHLQGGSVHGDVLQACVGPYRFHEPPGEGPSGYNQ